MAAEGCMDKASLTMWTASLSLAVLLGYSLTGNAPPIDLSRATWTAIVLGLVAVLAWASLVAVARVRPLPSMTPRRLGKTPR